MGKHHGRVNCICKNCRKEFTVVASKIKVGGGKFCSRDCVNEHNRGENHPLWKGSRKTVSRICKLCGKEFMTDLVELNRGNGKFCSRECVNQYLKGKNNPSWRGGSTLPVGRICQLCGTKFETTKDKPGKFCSRDCVYQYYTGENHPGWKGGRKKRTSKNRCKKKQINGFKAIKKRPGFVYLLSADNGLCKIGCSKKINCRIKELGVMLPYELELIMIIKVEDMYTFECGLHQQFEQRRVRGEWFELDKVDLNQIKNFALAKQDTSHGYDPLGGAVAARVGFLRFRGAP